MKKSAQSIFASYILMFIALAIVMLRVFYPFHRAIGFTLYALSWIPFLLGLRKVIESKKGIKYEQKIWGIIKAYKKHIIGGVFLILIFYVIYVVIPFDRSILTDYSDEEVQVFIEGNLSLIKDVDLKLKETISKIEESNLFSKSAAEFSAEDKLYIRGLWNDFAYEIHTLDSILEEYKTFYRLDYIRTPRLQTGAFMVAYSAFLTTYENSIRLTQVVDDEYVNSMLNEAETPFGKDSYFAIKQQITYPKNIVRLNAGAVYREIVQDHMTNIEYEFSRQKSLWIYSQIGETSKLGVDNVLSLFENKAFEKWMPLQKGVAEGMSRIRLTERENYIGNDILEEVKKDLQPGDILLQRRDLYMTNLGISGFFKHAAIYVGDVDKYFENASNLTSAEERLLERNDWVIEAIAPGVVLQTLGKSGNADYMVVLRPKVSKEEKLKALGIAISNMGKPYDYNFDFMTDNALVCSELVFKSYEYSIYFPLERLNGRLLLRPDSVADKVATGDLEFVTYLGGPNGEILSYENFTSVMIN